MKRVPTVLIVEDDPSLASLIAELLEEDGYAIQAVGRGAEVLALVNTTTLDLVILDWMLPDMNGVQLCRMIKERMGNTFLPVLMLTARSTLADRIAGLEAGADDYLTKPFHADELLARVRALLRIRAAEVDRSEALAALARQHDELQNAYNQLRATQAQLLQTYKLVALGELVAGVAHELNNPLAIILGNAELLPELNDTSDRHAVEQIIVAAQRARRVVQSLVTFARRGQIEENWYDPRVIVERALDLRRATLNTRGIALEVEHGPDLPMLWVDGPQIQHVLLNLLLNAEQALLGRPNPRIVIRVFASTTPIPPPPVLPGGAGMREPEQGERMVMIDVADNGPGLDEHIRDRVFEPFVTTKPVGQGTGLSLAISYGIVAQHGGSLQFSSEPGRGATFRIALPVHPRRTPGASLQTLDAPAIPPGRVLVIDDEPSILDLTQRILARASYAVSTSASARAALQMLQNEPYDAILCDIKMPDMDGVMFYDALQALKLSYQPRLIIMTGDTSNAQTAEFLQRSNLPVLPKPFTGQMLLAALASGDAAG